MDVIRDSSDTLLQS